MNVAKYTRSSVGHMFAHFERKDGVKFKNQDIDITRSHLNYNLHDDNRNQFEILNSILNDENIKVSKRKDLNVMCSWVITAPIEIQGDENKEKLFFEETYNFFSEKFGKQNVISAYVHMDETSPHMHFAFVPVFYDKNKDLYKINAKSIINKNLLNSIHPVFQNHLNAKLGQNFAKIHRHNTTVNKSIKELKQETADLNLQIIEYKQKIQELEQEFNEKIKENAKIPKFKHTVKKSFIHGEYVSIDDVKKILKNQEKRKELIINSNKKIKVLKEKLNLQNAKIDVLEKENKELKNSLNNNKREKRKIEVINLKNKIKNLENKVEEHIETIKRYKIDYKINEPYRKFLENNIDYLKNENLNMNILVYKAVCDNDLNSNFIKKNLDTIEKSVNFSFDFYLKKYWEDRNIDTRKIIAKDYYKLEKIGIKLNDLNKNEFKIFEKNTDDFIKTRFRENSRGFRL